MKNCYIVVEGIEGSGKTTISSFIYEILVGLGIFLISLVQEPGGTILAKKLAKLIKDTSIKEKITFETELLIFYAARSQLIENVIKPSIKKGIWIISDRSDLSSQAYQCGGRGLNSSFVEILRKNIVGKLEADLIFYLDVEPKVSLSRVYSRKKIDRFEREDLDFFQRVREKYIELVSKNKKVIFIDANKSLNKVKKKVYKKLSNWLKFNDI